jgi:hypothetical protein
MAPRETPRRKPFLRWNLRALLLLFIPLGIAFAYLSYAKRQYDAAWNAWNEVQRRVSFVALFNEAENTFVVSIPSKKLIDEDLITFTTYFNGYAGPGSPRVVKICLEGSDVSPKAIERFRKAVPSCELEP